MHFIWPWMFKSRLRYRLSSVLSDIRWVVSKALVSRRMDRQIRSKARVALESLRYDITVMCCFFKNTPLPLCNTKIHITSFNSYQLVFVMSTCTWTCKWQLQKKTVWLNLDFYWLEWKQVKFNLCNVSETNNADLSCFFIWFRISHAPSPTWGF